MDDYRNINDISCNWSYDMGAYCKHKAAFLYALRERNRESGVHAENDTGYTGITAIHPKSILPEKRSKNTSFTKEEKNNNHLVSKKESMQNTPSDL